MSSMTFTSDYLVSSACKLGSENVERFLILGKKRWAEPVVILSLETQLERMGEKYISHMLSSSHPCVSKIIICAVRSYIREAEERYWASWQIGFVKWGIWLFPESYSSQGRIRRLNTMSLQYLRLIFKLASNSYALRYVASVRLTAFLVFSDSRVREPFA
jgi:hypothetical protein